MARGQRPRLAVTGLRLWERGKVKMNTLSPRCLRSALSQRLDPSAAARMCLHNRPWLPPRPPRSEPRARSSPPSLPVSAERGKPPAQRHLRQDRRQAARPRLSLAHEISPKGSLGKNGAAPPLTGSTALCVPWR
jgi:hypothetical protein